MSADFRLQKARNCVDWILRALGRYQVNPEIAGTVEEFLSGLRRDDDRLQSITNPLALAVLLDQSPASVVDYLKQLRSFFHTSHEERLVTVDEFIANMKTARDNFGRFVEALEANKEDVAHDLRNAGAYTEIFVGNLLK